MSGAVQPSNSCCAAVQSVACVKNRPTLRKTKTRFSPQIHTHWSTNERQLCTPNQRTVTRFTPNLVCCNWWRAAFILSLCELLWIPSLGGKNINLLARNTVIPKCFGYLSSRQSKLPLLVVWYCRPYTCIVFWRWALYFLYIAYSIDFWQAPDHQINF